MFDMLYLNDNLFDDMFNCFTQNDLRSDVSADDNEFDITMDVPGVDKKNIDISFNDDVLTVNVKYEKKNDKKNYSVKERFYSNTSRSFYLENANPEAITAKLDNGVLNIKVAKMPKVETKKLIAIE
jgi:HSP20 family protein